MKAWKVVYGKIGFRDIKITCKEIVKLTETRVYLKDDDHKEFEYIHNGNNYFVPYKWFKTRKQALEFALDKMKDEKGFHESRLSTTIESIEKLKGEIENE